MGSENIALRYSTPSLRGRCPCTRHFGKDRGLPLRQAPSRLRLYPERSGSEYALRENESRGDHQGDGWRFGETPRVQRSRPGLEPHILLERHEGRRRRKAGWRDRQTDREGFRKLRKLPEGIRRCGPGTVRQRLGMACDGRQVPERSEDAECGEPDHPGIDAPADDRRLGARLLPGLPEPSEGFRGGFPRQAGQLGLRGKEPSEIAGRVERKKRRPDGPGMWNEAPTALFYFT